jgi:hypothetical protein
LLQEEAQKQYDQASTACGTGAACKQTLKYFETIKNDLVGNWTGLVERVDAGKALKIVNPQLMLSDWISGAAVNGFLKYLMSSFQWIYMNFLEAALYFAGLGAPILLVMALVPGYIHIAAGWLFVFFAVGINKIVYLFIVGVFSILLSQTSTPNGSDLTFYVVLGLGAPFIASTLVWGGGFAAAKAFQAPIRGGVGVATTIVSTATFGILSGIARQIDKGR